MNRSLEFRSVGCVTALRWMMEAMEHTRAQILIVDDEQHNIHVLGTALKERYRISVATSGEKALERMRRAPCPDMVLLDVVMPGMDGFEVCRRLRNDPVTRDVCVIFITARDSEADEAEGLALGAVDFITKPIREAIVQARIQTHLALQEQRRRIQKDEALLRATLESTRDGILVIGKNGTITHTNSAFARQWDVLPEILHLEAIESLIDHMKPKVENADLLSSKFKMPGHAGDNSSDTLDLKDGRIIERQSFPLIQEGMVSGRVWTFSDVTRQKRYEEQLQKAKEEAELANKAKSTFLATMSHEIRTPLNGVLGMAELLQDIPMDETGRDHVRVIRSSGQTLLTVINDILDYSRIEAGKLELEAIDFDPRGLLEEVFALARGFVRDKQVSLNLELDPQLPETVHGDPTRIRQILFNLLSNAVKFTHQGLISLRAGMVREQQGRSLVRFAVQDSGIGLDQEQISRLFCMFEQAEQSTSRKYGGTGLGLAISHRLARMMEGTIEVQSQPGKGSLFSVTLPLKAGQAPPVSREETPKHADCGTIPPDRPVLVAEDDPVNRAVIQGMMKRFGIHPDFAQNGHEAVALFQKGHYALVFMDCQMPGMDGFSACREIRQGEKKGERTAIVALTAFSMRGDREKCLDAGMDDYLTKPISIKGLQSALLRWLGANDTMACGPVVQTPDESPDLDRHMFLAMREDLEEDFEQTVRFFLTVLRQRVQAIENAFAASEWPRLTEAAHTLKGSSLQLGGKRVGALAGLLERGGMNQETALVASLIEPLKQASEVLSDIIHAEMRLADFRKDLGDTYLDDFARTAMSSMTRFMERLRHSLAKEARSEVSGIAAELAGLAGSYGLSGVFRHARRMGTLAAKKEDETPLRLEMEQLEEAVALAMRLLETAGGAMPSGPRQ
ncbi:MAG: response regulator [Magnetococcales bacterium]|nr:response regulator [Magnetococcales bacterium]